MRNKEKKREQNRMNEQILEEKKVVGENKKGRRKGEEREKSIAANKRDENKGEEMQQRKSREGEQK